MKLLHLTDLHMTGFTPGPHGLHPRIPEHAWWALERRYDLMGYLVPMALQQAQREFAPDFVLFGGDMVDDGFSEVGEGELVQVRDLAQGLATAPVGWLYGNHDGPQERFAVVFGGLNWTQDVGGVRLVGLNSGSMEPEEEAESSRVALAHLREALETNAAGLPVVVALHQWIFPTDFYGYSFARAGDALALIEEDPHVVAVLSGHYHDGRYETRHGLQYCTSRSLAEPPFCYTTYEFTGAELNWTTFSLNPGERRFVVCDSRTLTLRR